MVIKDRRQFKKANKDWGFQEMLSMLFKQFLHDVFEAMST